MNKTLKFALVAGVCAIPFGLLLRYFGAPYWCLLLFGFIFGIFFENMYTFVQDLRKERIDNL